MVVGWWRVESEIEAIEVFKVRVDHRIRGHC